MNRFFAAFASGTEKIVENILKTRVKDICDVHLSDGGVEFSTSLPYSDLNLFCMNNIFLVLFSGELDIENDMDAFIRVLLNSRDVDWDSAGGNSPKIRTFRLVTSAENRLVSVDNGLRSELERKIGRFSRLTPDRSRPDTEFWVLLRKENGRSVFRFLKRLSRHTAYDKILNQGELHPETAYMLCWLSRPKHTDVVVDPFCGYGAIPAERIKRFPFKELYAFDISEKCIAKTREKSGKKPNVTVSSYNALQLDERFSPETVDAIITDPPWGIYDDSIGDITRFYAAMMKQFETVLRSGGRAVILTAAKEELLSALTAAPRLTLTERYDILVSGKKAGIFVFEKA